MKLIETFVSDISKKEYPISEKALSREIRPAVLSYIKKSNPDFTLDSAIAITELNYFREKYIADFLVKEVGELGELEKEVLSSLKAETTISDKVDNDEPVLTLGQRVADKVATFGGSWVFIISFGLFLVIWIAINAFVFHNQGFDPYPFILLNLLLSCLAAIQAPIIMMSQNRQEEKDRERAKKDYMINLKSELEIRVLHEKIDDLLMNQQQDLIEIQKTQIEMMSEILMRLKKQSIDNE